MARRKSKPLTKQQVAAMWLYHDAYARQRCGAVKFYEQLHDWEKRTIQSVTPTTYIYKNGNEPGVVVGIINYPRFPSEAAALKAKALEVAALLLKLYRQMKVSVVFPDETVMLESEEAQ